MSKVVEDIIAYNSENHALDYKKVQYPLGDNPSRNDILKDISAMANHPADEDKYIIIGVVEQNGMACGFDDVFALTDEAKYQQFLESNIEPRINFEYKSFNYDGHQLAYFRIFKNLQRPYLFKKEVKDNTGKIEYRPGDGFTRQGSSTRRLVRDDFETIYKNRFAARDRAMDLVITPFIGKCEDKELSSYSLDFIDVSIENRSNRSINLELEIKVVFSEKIKVISRHELKKALQEQKDNQLQGYSFRNNLIPPISFDIWVETTNEFLFANRSQRIGEVAAVRILQLDKETNGFYQELIVLADGPGLISGEVIVRSDEFSEGMLKHAFELNYRKS
ncbi:MAG TPA: ATP-binding protein [Chryseolinea sp.]|nr:ATP-binding protein [Chryseolinea sp.]